MTAAKVGAPPSAPPHPRDFGPLLGNIPSLVRDFLPTFVKGWREVGDVCLYRGPRPMCLVAHPDHVQYVLEDVQPVVYPRSRPVIDGLRPLMGDGLFVSEGSQHSAARRLLEPLFTPAAVAGHMAAVVRATEALLESWGGPARVVDVQAGMVRLAMEVSCATYFGAGPGPAPSALLRDLSTAVDYAVPGILLPFSAPAVVQPRYHRSRKALERLDTAVYDAIAGRRRELAQGHPAGDDVLFGMLLARDPDGHGFSDREIRDEVMTGLFGAFKGIGVALTWLCLELSCQPAVGEQLQSELAGLGGRAPTAEEVARLPYLRQVIDETLRLHPPLWLWSRPAARDDVIGGYHINAGLFVLNIPWITHRHPDFWDDPERFDPERFAPGRTAERHPYAYFPFGGGPRGCIGENLSLLTLVIVVAMLAGRYRLEPDPSHEPHHGMDFMLRLDNGLPMTLRAASQ